MASGVRTRLGAWGKPWAAVLVAAAMPFIAGCSTAATPSPAATAPPPSASQASAAASAEPSGTVGPSAAGSATASTQWGVTGTWSGSWVRTAPVAGNGTMKLTLTDNAGAVSGTIEVTGSACLTKNQITGSVTGPTISLNVSDGGITAAYSGTIAGSKMNGTMTVTCPNVGTGTGTWTVSQG